MFFFLSCHATSFSFAKNKQTQRRETKPTRVRQRQERNLVIDTAPVCLLTSQTAQARRCDISALSRS